MPEGGERRGRERGKGREGVSNVKKGKVSTSRCLSMHHAYTHAMYINLPVLPSTEVSLFHPEPIQ